MSDPTPTESPPAAVSPWRWGVCVLLMLATVINYMDRIALNQLGRRIKGYFDLDDFEYSLLESAFSFAFGIGAITTGFIVDRLSVRWVYPLMVLGWSAAGVLTGFSTGYWMLLSCRFTLGFFEAGNWPCGLRTTKAVLRRDERSLGNSLFGSGTALGAVVTPLLILVLLRSYDPGESQRQAVMAVTGGTYAAVTEAPNDTWKFPFRVIGSLGVVWVALWFSLVPRSMLRDVETGTEPGAGRFRDVLLDRRFWLLFATTVGVNVTWHGFRAWLPLFLQEERGYTEAEMSKFTTLYYLVADIGTWTVGGFTLLLSRRGWGVHGSRLFLYALCSLLTLTSLTVPLLPRGLALEVCLLVVAFGALGLFPTYFALSQELSVKHQGKVTGTLGLCAHFSLALIYPVEGWIAKATGSKALVLGGVGVAPLFAFLLVWWFWPPPPAGGSTSPS